MFGYRARLGLFVLAVFGLLTTGAAEAGILSLWDGTGANDSTSWSALGPDDTVIPHSFAATSTNGVAISGSFAGNSGLVAIQCPAAPSCSWTGNFPAGDTLVWTFDNTTNIGTGPLTLGLGKAVLAGGVAIQADFQGVFTAKVEAFNGSSLIGTATAVSDSNSDSVFIGIQDTAAEITSLVFDLTLTGCANLGCGNSDFAVDKLISENPPAAVPGPIAGAGLPGLTLGRCWPSRLVATAEEDRLNILR